MHCRDLNYSDQFGQQHYGHLYTPWIEKAHGDYPFWGGNQNYIGVLGSLRGLLEILEWIPMVRHPKNTAV